MTARQKYGDEMSQHDDKPKKGERICPITWTNARAATMAVSDSGAGRRDNL
jgi:hypothetical protein